MKSCTDAHTMIHTHTHTYIYIFTSLSVHPSMVSLCPEDAPRDGGADHAYEDLQDGRQYTELDIYKNVNN